MSASAVSKETVQNYCMCNRHSLAAVTVNAIIDIFFATCTFVWEWRNVHFWFLLSVAHY